MTSRLSLISKNKKVPHRRGYWQIKRPENRCNNKHWYTSPHTIRGFRGETTWQTRQNIYYYRKRKNRRARDILIITQRRKFSLSFTKLQVSQNYLRNPEKDPIRPPERPSRRFFHCKGCNKIIWERFHSGIHNQQGYQGYPLFRKIKRSHTGEVIDK